jgi:hypothetical protein
MGICTYIYICRTHQLLKRIEKQHPADMMESIWGSYGFGGLTITIFAYLQTWACRVLHLGIRDIALIVSFALFPTGPF